MHVISKGLRRLTKHLRDDDDLYLLKNSWPSSDFPLLNNTEDDDDNDDAISISSCSTTSTVDDNPGTGRLVDKYLYQRGGRKVERLIFWMWIKLPYPHPVLVSQHILWKVRWESCRDRTLSLPYAIRAIERNPLLQRITLPGLRSLVRQTQSSSFNRSVVALTMLISASVRTNAFANFFIGISETQSIFNVESAALSHDDSCPEKRFTLLLVKLAKANVIALEARQPSAEIAQEVRQRLMQLVKAQRESLEVISETCFIYAEAISCMQFGGGDGVVSINLAETTYFLVILFLRSIRDLQSQIYSFELKIQQHIQIILSVFLSWLDGTLWRFMETCSNLGQANPGLLEIGGAFHGLFHAISSIHPGAKAKMPCIYSTIAEHRLINPYGIPRRVRKTDDVWQKDWLPVSNLVRRSTQRSARLLLASSDELHWEIWDSTLRHNHPITQMERIESMFNDGWETIAERTYYPASQVRVREDKLTEDFRRARARETLGGFNVDVTVTLQWWHTYKTYCRRRNAWAPFFRSSLDWDWDVAGCLKRMYTADKPSQPADARRPTANNSTFSADVRSTTWNVTAREPQMDLPREIRIRYATETGEIKYMKFVRQSSNGRASLSIDELEAIPTVSSSVQVSTDR